MKQQRIFYLDFIRGLSTLLILFYHFSVSLMSSNIDVPVPLLNSHANGTFGHMGVSLFFIISGAALMYTYDKHLDLISFYKKRFLSLFPMFWLGYLFCCVWFQVIHRLPFAPLPKWRFIFTLLGMDGYLASVTPTFYQIGEWFLGCIILLYLVFPFLRFLIKKYTKQLPFIVFPLFIAYVVYYPFTNMILDRDFIVRTPDLLFGMYFITYIKKVNRSTGIISLLILIIFLFIPIPMLEIFKIDIIGVSTFLFLVYIAQFFKQRYITYCFRIISKYSYAIFLVHHIVMVQFLNHFANSKVSIFGFIVLFLETGFLISIFSFFLYQLNSLIIKCLPAYFKKKEN